MMSALDVVVDLSECIADIGDAIPAEAAAELATLRATVTELRALIRVEHVKPPYDVNDDATTELAIECARLEQRIEAQARQLETAREIILAHRAYTIDGWHMQQRDAWLAANAPAPQAKQAASAFAAIAKWADETGCGEHPPQEQEREMGEPCKCIVAEMPVKPCGARCWHFNPDDGVTCLNCGNTGIQHHTSPQAEQEQAE